MHRRVTTRLLILLHRVLRHPLLLSTVLFAIISLGLAFEIHLFEREQGPPYDTYSGTLKGIKTRAGYLTSSDGRLFRFVVMVNTAGKTTGRILKILEEDVNLK